jgi:hypothetical protein
MSVVPREKAGAGAAVNNSVRQIGGALGVAILGSILTAAYRADLGGLLDALPAGVRQQASESVVATLETVRRIAAGPDADAARAATGVVDAAKEAFVSAMHTTAIFTAACALVAAVVVLAWLPGRRTVTSAARQRVDLVPRTGDGSGAR